MRPMWGLGSLIKVYGGGSLIKAYVGPGFPMEADGGGSAPNATRGFCGANRGLRLRAPSPHSKPRPFRPPLPAQIPPALPPQRRGRGFLRDPHFIPGPTAQLRLHHRRHGGSGRGRTWGGARWRRAGKKGTEKGGKMKGEGRENGGGARRGG